MGQGHRSAPLAVAAAPTLRRTISGTPVGPLIDLLAAASTAHAPIMLLPRRRDLHRQMTRSDGMRRRDLRMKPPDDPPGQRGAISDTVHGTDVRNHETQKPCFALHSDARRSHTLRLDAPRPRLPDSAPNAGSTRSIVNPCGAHRA